MAAICRVLAVLALLGACAKSKPLTSHRFVPTCQGMCDYYTACAGHSRDGDTSSACLADCDLLYIDQGRTNERMLWQLQQLDCPDLLAYIEGDDRTPLRRDQLQAPLSTAATPPPTN